MKISILDIPDSGELISIQAQDRWVQSLLKDKLAEFYSKDAELSGQLQLFRVEDNVTVRGEIDLKIFPTCDRCVENFENHLKVPILRYLAPYFSENTRAEDEEIELTEEDLDFSYYHENIISLADLIVEEVRLTFPMQFLCKPDCSGLCSRCGVNRNDKSCECFQISEASPWQVLKGLKVDK